MSNIKAFLANDNINHVICQIKRIISENEVYGTLEENSFQDAFRWILAKMWKQINGKSKSPVEVLNLQLTSLFFEHFTPTSTEQATEMTMERDTKRAFRIVLSKPETTLDITNAVSIRIINVAIPKHGYMVNEAINVIKFRECKSEDVWLETNIPAGDYESASDLLKCFVGALNARGKGDYSYTLNGRTDRAMIKCNKKKGNELEHDAREPGGQNAAYVDVDMFEMQIHPELNDLMGNLVRQDDMVYQSTTRVKVQSRDLVKIGFEELKDFSLLVPVGSMYTLQDSPMYVIGGEGFYPNLARLTMVIKTLHDEFYPTLGACCEMEVIKLI